MFLDGGMKVSECNKRSEVRRHSNVKMTTTLMVITTEEGEEGRGGKRREREGEGLNMRKCDRGECVF